MKLLKKAALGAAAMSAGFALAARTPQSPLARTEGAEPKSMTFISTAE
ncbi:MAG: hypothetical protein ACTTKL_10975 [Treponema sp.]